MGGTISSNVVDDLQPPFQEFASWPLARARAAVEAFHQQAFDFAADAGTLRRLCPSLGLARSERVVAALSAAPRLALVNATSFLLLVVTLADAAAEGLEAKFELVFDAHDFNGSGRLNLDELVFLLVHLTQGLLGSAGLTSFGAPQLDYALQRVAVQAFQYARRRLNGSISKATFVRWALKKFGRLGLPSPAQQLLPQGASRSPAAAAFAAPAFAADTAEPPDAAEAAAKAAEPLTHGYDLTALFRRLNVDVNNAAQVLPKAQWLQERVRTPGASSRGGENRGPVTPARGASARPSGRPPPADTDGTKEGAAEAVAPFEVSPSPGAPLGGQGRRLRPASAPTSAVQRPPAPQRWAPDAGSGEDETSGRLERFLLAKRREELAAAAEEKASMMAADDGLAAATGDSGGSTREKAVQQAAVGARPTTPMMKATAADRPKCLTGAERGRGEGASQSSHPGLTPAGQPQPQPEDEAAWEEVREDEGEDELAVDVSTDKKDALLRSKVDANAAEALAAAERATVQAKAEAALARQVAERLPFEKAVSQAASESGAGPESHAAESAEAAAAEPCGAAVESLPDNLSSRAPPTMDAKASSIDYLPWDDSAAGGALPKGRFTLYASAPPTPSSGGKTLEFLIAQAAKQEVAEALIKKLSVNMEPEEDEAESDAESACLEAAIMDAEAIAIAAEVQALAARQEAARLQAVIARARKRRKNATATALEEASQPPMPPLEPASTAATTPTAAVAAESTDVFPKDVGVHALEEAQSAFETIVTSTEPGAHSAEAIASVFKRYDWDGSGDLDVFELSSAVAELWGKPPTTAQVSTMVRASGAVATNTLTLLQFIDLLAKDWSTVFESTPVVEGCDAQPGDVYQYVFHDASLGFGVSLDRINSRIVVSDVSPEHCDIIHKGDSILAVNSAPLGKVNHPAALQQALTPLRRPVTLSFVRALPVFNEPQALEQISEEVVAAPKELKAPAPGPTSKEAAEAVTEPDAPAPEPSSEKAIQVVKEPEAPAAEYNSEEVGTAIEPSNEVLFEDAGANALEETQTAVEALVTVINLTTNEPDASTIDGMEAAASIESVRSWSARDIAAQVRSIGKSFEVYGNFVEENGLDGATLLASKEAELVEFLDDIGVETTHKEKMLQELIILKDGVLLRSANIVEAKDTVQAAPSRESEATEPLLEKAAEAPTEPDVLAPESTAQAAEVATEPEAPAAKLTSKGAVETAKEPITDVLHDEADSNALEDPHSAFETLVTSTEPGAHSAEAIASVFKRYDWDGSGDLDVFELSSAVAELWGKPPTTAQVSTMVRASGAVATNTLTLLQFTDLLAKDWSTVFESTAVVEGCDAQPGDVYQYVFHDASLGFGVSLDKINSRIVVSDVSPENCENIHKGDGILAVNSAPLGKVNHPAALQQALKPLRRPVTLSFVRGLPLFNESQALEQISEEVVAAPKELKAMAPRPTSKEAAEAATEPDALVSEPTYGNTAEVLTEPEAPVPEPSSEKAAKVLAAPEAPAAKPTSKGAVETAEEPSTDVLPEDSGSNALDEAHSAVHMLVTSTEPGAHSAEAIASVFRRYDWDGSGDLDVFELSSAVAELWGKPPTTAQVSTMIRASGAVATNTLTLLQFTDLLAKDWSTVFESTPVVKGCDAQPGDVYQYVFHDASLGFGVSFDKMNSRIVVSDVSPENCKNIHKGDSILAVNSAPLGKVNHPAALQQALKPLRRPVTLSFVRGLPLFNEPQALDQISEEVVAAPTKLEAPAPRPTSKEAAEAATVPEAPVSEPSSEEVAESPKEAAAMPLEPISKEVAEETKEVEASTSEGMGARGSVESVRSWSERNIAAQVRSIGKAFEVYGDSIEENGLDGATLLASKEAELVEFLDDIGVETTHKERLLQELIILKGVVPSRSADVVGVKAKDQESTATEPLFHEAAETQTEPDAPAPEPTSGKAALAATEPDLPVPEPTSKKLTETATEPAAMDAKLISEEVAEAPKEPATPAPEFTYEEAAEALREPEAPVANHSSEEVAETAKKPEAPATAPISKKAAENPKEHEAPASEPESEQVVEAPNEPEAPAPEPTSETAAEAIIEFGALAVELTSKKAAETANDEAPAPEPISQEAADALEETGALGPPKPTYEKTPETPTELEASVPELPSEKAAQKESTLHLVLPLRGGTEAMFGPTLAGQSGSVPTAGALSGKVVGIFFSAHWCPPCRGFTPVLAQAYKDIAGAGKPLELVFVSSDKDPESFAAYFADMPWLALPFADWDRKAALAKLYGVKGIPSLVFVDEYGTLITENGRAAILSDPTGALFPWTPKSALELPAAELTSGKAADAAKKPEAPAAELTSNKAADAAKEPEAPAAELTSEKAADAAKAPEAPAAELTSEKAADAAKKPGAPAAELTSEKAADAAKEPTVMVLEPTSEHASETPAESSTPPAPEPVSEEASTAAREPAAMEPELTYEPAAKLPAEPEAPAPEEAPALDFDAGAAELVLCLAAADAQAIAAAEACLPAAHRAYVASPAFAQEVAWRMQSLAHAADAAACHRHPADDAPFAPHVRFDACVPSVRGLFGDAHGRRVGGNEALDARLVAFVQTFDANGSGALEAPEFALLLRWFYAVAFAEEEEAPEGAGLLAYAPNGDAAGPPPRRLSVPHILFPPLPATQLDPIPLPGVAAAAAASPAEEAGAFSPVLTMERAVAGGGLGADGVPKRTQT